MSLTHCTGASINKDEEDPVLKVILLNHMPISLFSRIIQSTQTGCGHCQTRNIN